MIPSPVSHPSQDDSREFTFQNVSGERIVDVQSQLTKVEYMQEFLRNILL
jgi:hypothetical protein